MNEAEPASGPSPDGKPDRELSDVDSRPGRVTQFCICDVEMCYCPEIMEMTSEDVRAGREWTCPECLAGHHVLDPFGERS